MARKTGTVQPKQKVPEFTKEQMVRAACYRDRRDLVDALLKDGEMYTFEEVNSRINKFMKGKVS